MFWCFIYYGVNWIGVDYVDCFGFINYFGGMIVYKMNWNWVFGVDGNFIFGNKINQQNFFVLIVDSYGNVIDENGDVVLIGVNQCGFNVDLMVGKVILVLSFNQNLGLYFNVGVGYV